VALPLHSRLALAELHEYPRRDASRPPVRLASGQRLPSQFLRISL